MRRIFLGHYLQNIEIITNPTVEVEKGPKNQDFKNKLKRLRLKYHLKIKDLQGQDLEDFNAVSAEYKNYLADVKSIFTGLSCSSEGTVGSFFTKFLHQQQDFPDSPARKNENAFQFCEHQVFWAKYKDDIYVFTDMNNKADKSNAVVYLQSDDIRGFSQEEKLFLANEGVKNIQMIHALPEGNKELNNDFIPLSSAPMRHTPVAEGGKESSPATQEQIQDELLNKIQAAQKAVSTGHAGQKASQKATSQSNTNTFLFFTLLILLFIILIYVIYQSTK
jgi:hypothetical protein